MKKRKTLYSFCSTCIQSILIPNECFRLGNENKAIFQSYYFKIKAETFRPCPHYRASGRLRKKKSNFAGFSETNSRKKRPISREFRGNFRGQFRWKTIGKERPISWELPGQILLESDWFCADLRKTFNETRQHIYYSSCFIQLHVVCLTFEILFTTILHFFNFWGTLKLMFFKSKVTVFL